MPEQNQSSGRVAFIVAGLVVALLGGFGLGRLTGGDSTRPAAAVAAPTATADHTHTPGAGPHTHSAGGGSGAAAGGLEISASGYTLVPETTAFTAGRPGELAFRIVDGGQRAVTDFAVVHDKPLHLIVVRRDLTGYQHLHPTMAADGRWSVPLTLREPGIWRAYADFTANAPAEQAAVTLGADLTVRGDYAPRALPEPATEAAVDGFTVSYQGTPKTAAVQPLLFTVAPAATLERYLGAYGHLVVVREGDLGYVHVHPEPELSGGAVKFWLAAPSPGRYRMYFDFQVAGKVHTAEFTMRV
ncbi:hypothetical protein [Phytohabitans houttuyneae]|uniref:Secreted protein n=1 Tax=Phytohabitans houttuyneae TaxID=1076126 RepID=A0A6V8K9H8_9ACTN|nr:hypothetical protein [Phytohabitans houttuyneae]GFJ79081.1 hypothetical protein Phou_032610 [Phytohabitans houttuyneae]